MKVDVRPINVLGKPTPTAQRKKAAATQGNLHIGENRNHRLGRVVLCATLTNATNGLGTQLLPELMDAQVIWAEDGFMRVRGVEEIDGTMYGQTWDVKVL